MLYMYYTYTNAYTMYECFFFHFGFLAPILNIPWLFSTPNCKVFRSQRPLGNTQPGKSISSDVFHKLINNNMNKGKERKIKEKKKEKKRRMLQKESRKERKNRKERKRKEEGRNLYLIFLADLP